MATEYHLRQSKIGLLKQTNWATPWDATANFKTINANTGITFDPAVFISEFNSATGSTGLMTQESRKYVDGISGMPSVTYSCPATLALLTDHLVAAFQYCSEDALTPFAKRIKPVNAFVDFKSDGGYEWTLAFTPSGDAVADSIILENAVIDSLEFTIDRLANGVQQLANLNVTWKGNEMNFGQNISGTWVAAPTTGYLNSSTLSFTLDLTVNSTLHSDLCWRRFTMKMINNFDSDCKTTGGKVNNYNMMKPELIFEIDVPYNSSTYVILPSYKAGDNAIVNFYNGTGAASGELNITSTKNTLTANPLQSENDKSVLKIQVKADQPTAGYGSVIQWTDVIDGGYPNP